MKKFGIACQLSEFEQEMLISLKPVVLSDFMRDLIRHEFQRKFGYQAYLDLRAKHTGREKRRIMQAPLSPSLFAIGK